MRRLPRPPAAGATFPVCARDSPHCWRQLTTPPATDAGQADRQRRLAADPARPRLPVTAQNHSRPAVLLYGLGRRPGGEALAIVGSRRPSETGRRAAATFAGEIAGTASASSAAWPGGSTPPPIAAHSKQVGRRLPCSAAVSTGSTPRKTPFSSPESVTRGRSSANIRRGANRSPGISRGAIESSAVCAGDTDR